MTLLANFPRQSSEADWTESILLVNEDDGEPCWTSIPGDLVATLTLRESFRNWKDETEAVLTADTTGSYLTAFVDGYLEIDVPASVMTDIDPNTYEVFLKLETGGRTLQFIVGNLPIYRGA